MRIRAVAIILIVGSLIPLVGALPSLPPAPMGDPRGTAAGGDGGLDVLTQHNDNARSGSYLVERQLTPAAVRSGRFGRLYTRRVDGDVLAQPLYVHGIPTRARGVKDLVVVATAKNTLYAFDAGEQSIDPGAGVVWSVSLGPSRQLRRPTCVPPGDTDCDTRDGGEICAETYNGFVGVTSTPVIDRDTHTLYVVGRISARKDAPHDGANYLFAIDLADGSYRLPPRKIDAVDPASGDVFDPHCQRNRPGLLLANGVVYLAFGTLNCDGFCAVTKQPYHGWVLGYRASDLAQVAVFNTSPGGAGAGVWQSGNGLAARPDGTIYFETGNDYINCKDPRFTDAFKQRYFDKCSPVDVQLGDSFVKLQATAGRPGLRLSGWFTPNNAVELRDADVDLGSGGPVVLPGDMVLGGGKQGRYYVVDARTMRLTQDRYRPPAWPFDGFQAFFNTWHRNASRPACPRNDTPGGCYVDPAFYGQAEEFAPNIHGGPVYWARPDLGYALIYQMAEKDYLKAFTYDLKTHRVAEQPRMVARVKTPDGMPGGFSSLSANGTSTGIVWTSLPTGDAQWMNQPGVLHAFDASTLVELWADPPLEGTLQAATRPRSTPDDVLFAKFTPPTIADGRVYRATFSNLLVVYGLRDRQENKLVAP